MTKELKIQYIEECKEDKYSCGGGWIERKAVGVSACCEHGAKNVFKNRNHFNEDADEKGAADSLRLFDMYGARFCPKCGAPIVLEKVTFND